MRRILLACAVLSQLPVLIHGQSPQGPTMEETKAWLESDGKDLMRAHRLQADRAHLMLFQSDEHIDFIRLDSCVLTWREIESTTTTTFSTRGENETPGSHTTDVTVALNDVSLGGITTETESTLTDKPIQIVRITIRQPEALTSFSARDLGNPAAIRFARLPVQSAEDGQRIVNALKWAATLCGAGTKSGPF